MFLVRIMYDSTPHIDVVFVGFNQFFNVIPTVYFFNGIKYLIWYRNILYDMRIVNRVLNVKW